MNIKLFALTSAFVLSAAAQSVNAGGFFGDCVATADLRTNGTADVIRVTNQNADQTIQVRFRIMNASGGQIGHDYIVPLASNASFRTTVGGIYFNTGASPLNSILLVFNPNHLIQVVQSEAFSDIMDTTHIDAWLQFQATYKNTLTGQMQPLLFTCETVL